MLESRGGLLLLSYQLEIDALPNSRVSVQIDARFAGRSLVYQVPATSAVERELDALFTRLMHIESAVNGAFPVCVSDLKTGTYPALGIALTVRDLSRDGCELEMEISDPNNRSASLRVVNGVAARFIDDFIENLMEGAVEPNHPRNRSTLAREPARVTIGPAGPRVAKSGF